MKEWLMDFAGLIYPPVCPGCSRPLFRNEKVLCTYCLHGLPRTNFHRFRENPVEQTFWGRVLLEGATSFLFFSKGGKVQQLMHAIKYRNQKKAGFFLGELFGREIAHTEPFSACKLIIPVPLHPKKLRKRGYNQSEIIGRGMGKTMNIPVRTDILMRRLHSDTQTRKSRYNRWINVRNIFSLKNQGAIYGRHILLIDDVLTTGATLEACIQTLNVAGELKISVATLAYADM